MSRLRNPKKNKIKNIISFIVLMTIVFLFFIWETKLRDDLLFQEVIVLKEATKEGQQITEDLLFTIKLPIELTKNIIVDKSEIIGLSANHYIPMNIPLAKEFFVDKKLFLKENEVLMDIPASSIISIPNSIRRGDEVQITVFISSDEVLSNQINIIKQSAFETICFYVKDSANREIISTNELNRNDGSGIISHIEIVMDENKIEDLKDNFENKKFIITRK